MPLDPFYAGYFLRTPLCVEWDGTNHAEILDWINSDGAGGTPPPAWTISSVTASVLTFAHTSRPWVRTVNLGFWVYGFGDNVTVANPAGCWKTSDPYGRPEDLNDMLP